MREKNRKKLVVDDRDNKKKSDCFQKYHYFVCAIDDCRPSTKNGARVQEQKREKKKHKTKILLYALHLCASAWDPSHFSGPTQKPIWHGCCQYAFLPQSDAPMRCPLWREKAPQHHMAEQYVKSEYHMRHAAVPFHIGSVSPLTGMNSATDILRHIPIELISIYWKNTFLLLCALVCCCCCCSCCCCINPANSCLQCRIAVYGTHCANWW